MPRRKLPDPDYPDGKELKQIRERLEINQHELAYMIGVDQKTISYWENGRPIRSRAHKILLSQFREQSSSPDIENEIRNARFTLMELGKI